MVVDMFKNSICNCCKNSKCNENIKETVIDDLKIYKCVDYIKDKSKIIPIEKPLYVTAERDYVKRFER